MFSVRRARGRAKVAYADMTPVWISMLFDAGMNARPISHDGLSNHLLYECTNDIAPHNLVYMCGWVDSCQILPCLEAKLPSIYLV